MDPPKVVAETQIASDARDVAVSLYGEWKDKYVIGGVYWPPHFVILDAKTMEPLKVVSTRGVSITGEYVNEARVAAIYNTPKAPTWMVAVKELGQMWQVDYSDLNNLRIEMINTNKFLHDGFFDPTHQYFQIAANASNRMEFQDTVTRKAVGSLDTGKKPHPGPGANWTDKECGPVGATVHLGEGKITAWGNDPKGHPDKAWKTCYSVATDGPGLFIRTHPNSPYVIADQVIHPEPEIQQSIKILDKATRKIVKTIKVTDQDKAGAVHIEFNHDGSEFWVSVWVKGGKKNWSKGEIVVYDTKTLKEKARIKGLETPTGKFNVHNRINHIT
jgi:nitrite reductase (NO-forming)/hydroxylamine reductase